MSNDTLRRISLQTSRNNVTVREKSFVPRWIAASLDGERLGVASDSVFVIIATEDGRIERFPMILNEGRLRIWGWTYDDAMLCTLAFLPAVHFLEAVPSMIGGGNYKRFSLDWNIEGLFEACRMARRVFVADPPYFRNDLER